MNIKISLRHSSSAVGGWSFLCFAMVMVLTTGGVLSGWLTRASAVSRVAMGQEAVDRPSATVERKPATSDGTDALDAINASRVAVEASALTAD